MLMDASIVTIGILSELSAGLAGIIGFGDAISFYYFWRLVEDFAPSLLVGIPGLAEDRSTLHFVAAMLAMRAMLIFGYQVYLVRRDLRWDLIQSAAPLQILSTIAGCAFLDAYGTADWLHAALGTFCTVFAVAYFAVDAYHHYHQQQPKNKDSSPTDAQQQKRWLVAASVFSGFGGGVTSIAAIPLVCVALILSFSKTLVKGTFPLLLECSFVTKTIYEVILHGPSHKDSSVFVAWRHLLVSNVGGIVGMYIGHVVGKIVQGKLFDRIVAFMLLLAGLIMFWSISAVWLVLAVVAFCALVVVFP